ncbi:uncharacterized protein LOC133184469 [Saccostrea echinata]|uniref:uncharacterized protein LOC133184469 n=1 Tax=Saccostrea echinata TaxID=191078 RepID=UPI002A84146E|nr:uncharacterized protein LOC133184469 [Saccostrea echinata]
MNDDSWNGECGVNKGSNQRRRQTEAVYGVLMCQLARKGKKWWDDQIFKSGPGKNISVIDYIDYINFLDGTVGAATPHERLNKVNSTITGFFNFFSTDDYRPPPAYDSLFSRTNTNPPKLTYHRRSNRSNPYLQDDRNLWEKLHECFEMSILQQIIWLAALAFSISYIVYGLMHKGDCYWKVFNKKGKVEEEEDLTGFIQVEGGILCATILYAFLCRFFGLLESRRTHRQSRDEIEGKKKCGCHLFFIGLALYIANFGFCVAGATKVFHFYDNNKTEENKTYTIECDTDFYSFYYNAKIGELVVLMPYALYILIAMIFVPDQQKRWFLRRKWRQWVRLLDADQDGIISADDMERTNAKLEQIRRLVGARDTPLSAEEQKKWWNDHIFKSGPGKDISMTDYVMWVESNIPLHEMANKVKPIITGFFNFFSTEDYRKKNLIIGEEDFVMFWAILADVNERHCRKMFVKHIPSPLTMAFFLEDFEAFLSHNEFWNEYAYRVFNILKYRDSCRCCRV